MGFKAVVVTRWLVTLDRQFQALNRGFKVLNSKLFSKKSLQIRSLSWSDLLLFLLVLLAEMSEVIGRIRPITDL